jgi:hypothetical protein
MLRFLYAVVTLVALTAPALPGALTLLGAGKPSGGGGGGAAAWNPADAGTSITVSGAGNVIATYTGATFGSHFGVRSTTSHGSGKYYVEFTMAVGTSGNPIVGIADAGATIPTGYPGQTNYGIGYQNDNAVFLNTGSNVTNGFMPTYTTGDVIGMAVDMGNNKIWWRKNGGSWNGTTDDPTNPATGYNISSMVGPFFLAFSGLSQFAGGDGATINPTPSSPPSGYGNW